MVTMLYKKLLVNGSLYGLSEELVLILRFVHMLNSF